LDIAGLYEQILRELMLVQPRPGEKIADQVQRVGMIQGKRTESAKLEARLRKEKQFNRKVEINAQLRSLRKEIEDLSKPGAAAIR
jgi:uncharacterized protein YhaN